MKFFKIYFLVSIIMFISLVCFALVQERKRSSMDYKFELPAGSRIVVVKPGASCYFKITPADLKDFDFKVPESKVLSGVLILKSVE